jgi:predicted ArsR family transcriptional regulator
MSPASWYERFSTSTRGRMLALLRRSSLSIADLGRRLGIADNAVRTHLAGLERDGLVEQCGVRRGTGGKPASLYRLTADSEELFPKAYRQVLSLLLDVLVDRLGTQETEELLREVGRRAAPLQPTEGALRARVEAAVRVLEALGGDAEIEELGETLLIRGYSCPLSAVVAGHPQVCSLAEELLSSLIGVPVREVCDRGERPRCAFEVPLGASTAVP